MVHGEFVREVIFDIIESIKKKIGITLTKSKLVLLNDIQYM